MLLHVPGKFHALRHVLVLHELKHDIALTGVGVEALITLLIVFLYQDDGVLSLCHLQIGARTVHSQRIRLQSPDLFPLRHRIGMYGDKQVRLVPVGDVGTGMQGDEHIRLAGIDDFHVRAIALHIASEGKCHIQIDILFF